MNMKISVIVPIYNAEKYLRRALDSICNQTYKNLEIILIDDGSTDGSGAICDEYKEKDARIVLVHQKNSGVSVTRNKALSLLTGEMIAFVDADDYIIPCFFEKMIQLKKEHNAEIAICNFKRFSSEPIPDVDEHSDAIQVWNKEEALNNVYGSKGYLVSGTLWNKLYDAKLFEGFRFPEGLKNEDEFLLPKVIDRATNIVFTSDIMYYYYANTSSITTEKNYLISEDIYKVFDDRMQYFQEKGKEYNYFIKLTKKAYLDRVISRYKKTGNKDLQHRYREKYTEFKSDVSGIGYLIFYYSPKMYYFVVKLLGK